ncbi:hypothetical protein ACJD0Z_17535 [Flavobacteriaceae bacterium M23B6Z8]
MKEGIIKDAYEKIIKEIQTLITISYLLMVAVGMLFNYHKFEEFGINIFDYADVFDFLIAPFSDLKILLFSVGSVLISYLVLKTDSFWKKRYPKWYSITNFGLDKKKWFETYRAVLLSSVFIIYLFIAAAIYGDMSARRIRSQDPIKITFSDNTIKEGILIGKTKDILFLINKGGVDAIPLSSSVKEYEVN